MVSTEALEERIAKLEARVHELEDDRAIRELLGRYGYNADCCRDDEYVQLYTEDGAIELISGDGESAGARRRWEGRAALKQFITSPTNHQKPGFYGRAMHLQGNNVVSHIQGDNAVVNTYSVVLHDDAGKLRLHGAGNNQWTLHKVGGEWKIKERRRSQIGGSHYLKNVDATPK